MENANITLIIKQTAEGETDSSELITRGEFRYHKGSYFIDYDETEATGYDGSHVQLRVADGVMNMTRTGKAFSSLLFEDGQRHYCHYGTEYGSCMIGITTLEIKNTLSAQGGEVCARYTIDVNAGLVTTNEITVRVRLLEKE